MTRFLLTVLVLTGALGATAWMLPGVTVGSWPALLVGALALAAVNAVVRPILAVLSLPVTLLTLGLFSLVVNGASFSLAAWLVPGFEVASFGTAVVAALVFSVLSTVLGWFTREDPPRD